MFTFILLLPLMTIASGDPTNSTKKIDANLANPLVVEEPVVGTAPSQANGVTVRANISDTESDAHSPVGLWLSYDRSKQPSSVIAIKVASDGTLFGIVAAGIYHGETHPEAYCSRCSDKTLSGNYGIGHNEEVLGKSVLWSFSKSGDKWKHGMLLHVRSGTVYPTTLALRADGSIMDVTVHAGFFSKTVQWKRLDKDAFLKLCRKEDALHTSGKTFATTCIPSFVEDTSTQGPMVEDTLDHQSTPKDAPKHPSTEKGVQTE